MVRTISHLHCFGKFNQDDIQDSQILFLNPAKLACQTKPQVGHVAKKAVSCSSGPRVEVRTTASYQPPVERLQFLWTWSCSATSCDDKKGDRFRTSRQLTAERTIRGAFDTSVAIGCRRDGEQTREVCNRSSCVRLFVA